MGLLIGTTATRSGLTPVQVVTLVEFLIDLDVQELHHGDCLGGDADVDLVACSLAIRRVAHPPVNDKLRAHCRSEAVLSPEDYKARDRAIVLQTGVLIGLPRTMREQRYGGTWYTIGYARTRGRPVVLINPDGTVTKERTHGWF